MQMKVSNKEPLGAETHLFLATKSQSIVARVQASAKGDFKIGETVNFKPSMDRCKFFVKNPEDLSKEINICEAGNISSPWLKNAITGEVGYKVQIGSEIRK
jgi:multiple sugar transport system ATP-binding protein